MKKRVIKICGIIDVSTALAAAKAGADFLGLVFAPDSKRVVDIKQAKAISNLLRTTSTKTVAIFTEHSALEMEKICRATDIDIIQLHGERSKKEHRYLDPKITRIYAQSYSNQEEEASIHTDPQRDYLLFDSSNPGTGTLFDWKQFNYFGEYRWFLAGGLNNENIYSALDCFKEKNRCKNGSFLLKTKEKSKGSRNSCLNTIKQQNHLEREILTPYGVDVSSGVENSLGIKEISLINSFIKKVDQYE